MKKITIEILYDEEKDLFFHLGIIRTQLKSFIKNKSNTDCLDSNFDQKIEQDSIGGSHTIEFND